MIHQRFLVCDSYYFKPGIIFRITFGFDYKLIHYGYWLRTTCTYPAWRNQCCVEVVYKLCKIDHEKAETLLFEQIFSRCFQFSYGAVCFESLLKTPIFRKLCVRCRGVTRLDGARGKKQVWGPMVEPELFRKQISVLKKVLVKLLGLFGASRGNSTPRWHSAPP